MPLTQTFIISLPKDEMRRQPLLVQLRQLDIPHRIFEGVYGASLSDAELAAAYDREKAIYTFNRELGKGEIGCALSHIGIYREMVASNISHAFVLEDDTTVLDPKLPQVLAQLEQVFPADRPVVVLLNYVRRYVSNRAMALDSERKLYSLYRARGAHGYFLTRAAAELLAKGLYPTYAAADRWEHIQKRIKIDIKVLVPYCIGLTSDSQESRITAVDQRSIRTKNAAIGFHLRRHFAQLRYFICERPFMRVRHQQYLDNDLIRHYERRKAFKLR
jgi:glycosyl transferase family 25